MNVEIVAEAALFPEKEYINGIFVAVYNIHILCNFILLCTYIPDRASVYIQ